MSEEACAQPALKGPYSFLNAQRALKSPCSSMHTLLMPPKGMTIQYSHHEHYALDIKLLTSKQSRTYFANHVHFLFDN